MWMATASAFCTSIRLVFLSAEVPIIKTFQIVINIFLGFPLVITMNPVDVVATRLYNQKVVNGKGVLYSGIYSFNLPDLIGINALIHLGPFDCLYKTYQQEGLAGCYKGTVAHYMRLGIILIIARKILIFIFIYYSSATHIRNFHYL